MPMAEVLEDVFFADYINVDARVAACSATTGVDVISHVRNRELVAVSEDEEEDEAPVEPPARKSWPQ